MSRMQKFLVPLTLATLFLGLAGTAFARVEKEWVETYSLAADGRVSLENINGDVTIEVWDRAEVEVRYLKYGRTEESLERVEVVIDAESDRIDISTDYEQTRGYNNHASVEFTLRVPRTAALDEIDLVNGDFELAGPFAGDVRVELVNGDATLGELGGDIEVSTVNGEIRAEMSSLGDDQRVRLESVNGDLELTLPAGIDADVDVDTVHGRITNDFGLEVKRGEYVGSSMRGSLGRGGTRIQLENVNGDIEIRRN